MTANQLIGLAPAIVMRTLASSCASFVTPPEQSLTKKTSYPSLRAARTDWVRQTSVTRPAMTSFLRPVASTAARTSGCDQACDDGRSIGVMSGKASVISLKRGSTRTLPCAPTVVSTVGTPNAFATCARAATLLTSRPRSMECTLMATAGWWSMSTRTEFSIVSSLGLFIMSFPFLFKLIEVSGASLAAHKVFNRHLDFLSAREHSPCHIGTREHLRCRSLHRPLWVARAMPVFRQVPNKCAPSQHHFEYFALHSLESIQLVDWNAACSQRSSGKEQA